MVYTTEHGIEIKYNEIDTNPQHEIFKVNLPLTKEDFIVGCGEGVWASCSEEDYEKLNSNEECMFVVKVLNDSFYYPNLKYGMDVLCLFNGTNRPVAIKTELDHHYGECITVLEKKELIEKVNKIRNER